MTNGEDAYLVSPQIATRLKLNRPLAWLSGHFVNSTADVNKVSEYITQNGITPKVKNFHFEWRSDEDGLDKLKAEHWQLAELLPILKPLQAKNSLMTASHVFLDPSDTKVVLDHLELLGVDVSFSDKKPALLRKTLGPWPLEVDSLCVTFYESRSFYHRITSEEVSIFHLTQSTWGKVTYIRESGDLGPERRKGTCTLRHFAQIYAPYSPEERSEYVSEDLARYAATGEHRIVTSFDDNEYLEAAYRQPTQAAPVVSPSLRPH